MTRVLINVPEDIYVELEADSVAHKCSCSELLANAVRNVSAAEDRINARNRALEDFHILTWRYLSLAYSVRRRSAVKPNDPLLREAVAMLEVISKKIKTLEKYARRY